MSVDKENRELTSRNHSATHLLHKALRTVLGSHVEQAGSLVTRDRLRFDFTHFSAMTPEEIEKVEKIVNDEIAASLPVVTDVMSLDEAKKTGAMALFGEKYGEKVMLSRWGISPPSFAAVHTYPTQAQLHPSRFSLRLVLQRASAVSRR